MIKQKKKRPIWIAVKVDRGLPAEVKAYKTKDSATRRERSWRNRMNLDYEDSRIFRVDVE